MFNRLYPNFMKIRISLILDLVLPVVNHALIGTICQPWIFSYPLPTPQPPEFWKPRDTSYMNFHLKKKTLSAFLRCFCICLRKFFLPASDSASLGRWLWSGGRQGNWQSGSLYIYTVHCISTCFTVHCTLHSDQCTLYNVHCTLCTVLCELHSVHIEFYCTLPSKSCIHSSKLERWGNHRATEDWLGNDSLVHHKLYMVAPLIADPPPIGKKNLFICNSWTRSAIWMPFAFKISPKIATKSILWLKAPIF